MRDTINKILLDKVQRRRDADMAFIESHCSLLDDFRLDSLDVMEVIMECEGELGKRIPDNKLQGLSTKEDIYKLFENAD